MRSEYEFNLSNFCEHWFLGRLAALVLFGFYAGYILFAGYVNEFVVEPLDYLIFPSLAFSFVFFAKHSKWHHTGDLMFVGGWVYLLWFAWWLFIEEAFIYT